MSKAGISRIAAIGMLGQAVWWGWLVSNFMTGVAVQRDPLRILSAFAPDLVWTVALGVVGFWLLVSHRRLGVAALAVQLVFFANLAAQALHGWEVDPEVPGVVLAMLGLALIVAGLLVWLSVGRATPTRKLETRADP